MKSFIILAVCASFALTTNLPATPLVHDALESTECPVVDLMFTGSDLVKELEESHRLTCLHDLRLSVGSALTQYLANQGVSRDRFERLEVSDGGFVTFYKPSVAGHDFTMTHAGDDICSRFGLHNAAYMGSTSAPSEIDNSPKSAALGKLRCRLTGSALKGELNIAVSTTRGKTLHFGNEALHALSLRAIYRSNFVHRPQLRQYFGGIKTRLSRDNSQTIMSVEGPFKAFIEGEYRALSSKSFSRYFLTQTFFGPQSLPGLSDYTNIDLYKNRDAMVYDPTISSLGDSAKLFGWIFATVKDLGFTNESLLDEHSRERIAFHIAMALHDQTRGKHVDRFRELRRGLVKMNPPADLRLETIDPDLRNAVFGFGESHTLYTTMEKIYRSPVYLNKRLGGVHYGLFNFDDLVGTHQLVNANCNFVFSKKSSPLDKIKSTEFVIRNKRMTLQDRESPSESYSYECRRGSYESPELYGQIANLESPDITNSTDLRQRLQDYFFTGLAKDVAPRFNETLAELEELFQYKHDLHRASQRYAFEQAIKRLDQLQEMELDDFIIIVDSIDWNDWPGPGKAERNAMMRRLLDKR